MEDFENKSPEGERNEKLVGRIPKAEFLCEPI